MPLPASVSLYPVASPFIACCVSAPGYWVGLRSSCGLLVWCCTGDCVCLCFACLLCPLPTCLPLLWPSFAFHSLALPYPATFHPSLHWPQGTAFSSSRGSISVCHRVCKYFAGAYLAFATLWFTIAQHFAWVRRYGVPILPSKMGADAACIASCCQPHVPPAQRTTGHGCSCSTHLQCKHASC
jgi:hypothetical protein